MAGRSKVVKIEGDDGLDTRTASSNPPFLDLIISLASLALRLCANISRLAYELLRPLAPQLIPLGILCLVLPFVILTSLSAGLVVWKTSAISWEEPVYFQYGDGPPPHASISLNLPARQTYDISLHLTIPTLDSNYALGNFMASLTIATPSNKTLVSVRRPSMVVRSNLKSMIFTSPKSTMDISVPLLQGYALGISQAIAHIEVGRRDHWRSIGSGEGRELSVLSASLRGTLRHQGVRGVWSRFPIFTASIASITFFAITVVVVGGFLISSTSLFTSWFSSSEPEDTPESPAALHTIGDVEKPLRRKPSKRKSMEFKHEPGETIIPELVEPEDKPARRRIQRKEPEDD